MDNINNLINNEEVIDSKTQIRLIKIYKETGNLDVRNRLISSYYKMIRKIIRKYNSNIPFDELFNEGVISLIKAINSFDIDKGYHLSTYAHKSISRAIYNYVMLQKEQVTYTPGFLVLRSNYYKIINENPDINDSEIRQRLNISEKTLEYLKKAFKIIYYEEDPLFKESKYFESFDNLDNIEDLIDKKCIIDLIFNESNLTKEEQFALEYLYIKDLQNASYNNCKLKGYAMNSAKNRALRKVRKVFFEKGIKYI